MGIKPLELKLFLDYFYILGCALHGIAANTPDSSNVDFRFNFEAKGWTSPLQLKAGTVPFPTTESTFYLGSSTFGRLFVVWSPADTQEQEEIQHTDDEGVACKVSHIKQAHGLAVQQFIGNLFCTEPALKDQGVFGSEDVDVHATGYRSGTLSWAGFKTLTNRFMELYESHLQPDLVAQGEPGPLENGTVVPLEPKVWPNLLVTHIEALTLPIHRIATRCEVANSRILTFRDLEIVATCERLMVIAATGSLRPALKIWDDFELRPHLARYNFPYFNTEVFNPWTGDIDLAQYGSQSEGRFAHIAAIAFAIGDTAAQRAAGIALIEYKTLRNSGGFYRQDEFAVHMLMHM
ncbi:hypothetical protein JCM1841_006712 [Sporobolomyces salmonicolor]